MYPNGIAVIAITRRGVETAVKIKQALIKADLSCNVYVPRKYYREELMPLDKKLNVFIKEIYSKVDALVSIMATGITIRAVAPLLEGKLIDPAVIGVDSAGKFVISLLSGHYGGANLLTQIIAEGIGATAVITTASEALNKQSVDEFARLLHLTIVNPESLVAVNAAVVNEERVAFIVVGDVNLSEIVSTSKVQRVDTMNQAAEIVGSYDAAAIITKESVVTTSFPKPVTLLKPKRIIIGIGARKNVAEDQVITAVNAALSKVNLPIERVDGLATVDLKKETTGLVNAAAKLRLKLAFLTVEELGALKHDKLSPDSELVKKTIGVGGVCEQAALIKAGKNPQLILKKQKLNGVTIAIAEGE
ncbi:MAG: cobalt-precorrin 5A hydrolase [Candidatus Bathyarchaeota archaeon]|nr:cobalt-precorrin 5A hydrolase [Candidatus Bathyarchaeota archaeon]